MATLYKVTTTSTNSSYYGVRGNEQTSAEEYVRVILSRVNRPDRLNQLLTQKFLKASPEDTTAVVIQSGLTKQEAEDLKSQYVHPRGTKYDNTNANTVAGVQYADHQVNVNIAQAVADYVDPNGDYNEVYEHWFNATGYEINTSNLIHYLSDLHDIQRVLEDEPEDLGYTLRKIKRKYAII